MTRPLFLTGFMGTGKSTLGREIAQRTGRRFVDVDQAIEAQAGKSIVKIWNDEGEAHFRQLERAAVEALLVSQDGPVVALGGGALLHRETRLRALERAIVISLHAEPTELLRRIAAAGETRPLALSPDLQSLEILLEQRASAYAEAHARLRSDLHSPTDLVVLALQIWNSDPIAVAASHSSYAVEIGEKTTVPWLTRVLQSVSQSVLISDRTVSDLFGAELRTQLEQLSRTVLTITLPPGEEHKNPQTLLEIWTRCLKGGVDRKSVFVGMGGGVVTDIAGFAAATFMRGVPWLAMPTTLLSMVDASVGGKTAVDLEQAKNAIGAFWQPKAVLCDIARLRTEPDRGYRSALAEVVKTALLGDPALFELLEEQSQAVLARESHVVLEMVRRCIAVKAAIVSKDERESGLRAALNLGHTLGHALEAHGGYGRLTHGEAVSLGLVAALHIGTRLHITPEPLVARTVALLDCLGLPTNPQARGLAEAAQLVGYDKKRAGADVRFVLVSELGKVVFETLPVADVQTYAQQIR